MATAFGAGLQCRSQPIHRRLGIWLQRGQDQGGHLACDRLRVARRRPRYWAKRHFPVIEGDLETENDAERIRAKGVPAIQITTGTACHLDAHMVHNALHQLDLSAVDLLFIENVGNLVCPASFDLGHHRNVVLLSIPEGDDKPAKYPVMFRAADSVLLSKSDLLQVMDDFDPKQAEHYVRQLANAAPVIPLSAKTGAGMQDWIAWLEQEIESHRKNIRVGQITRPMIQPDGVRFHAIGKHERTITGHHHHHP